MILVDTSVWIDFLRQRQTAAVQSLGRVMVHDFGFGLTGIIYQEILQGADTPESFERLADYFGSQRFYHPRDPLQTYAAAASLYRRCREQGVTIRSSIDCLIAQIAIEHGLLLLHSDRDYTAMQSVIPELQLFSE